MGWEGMEEVLILLHRDILDSYESIGLHWESAESGHGNSNATTKHVCPRGQFALEVRRILVIGVSYQGLSLMPRVETSEPM